MQVWRPISIFCGYAKMRNALSSGNILRFAESGNILQAKMAVQGMKGNSLQLVLQYNCGAIVAFITVKGKTVHTATHKRKYGRTRWSPYINAQVQAARLFAGFYCVKKGAAAINGSMLIVPTDAVDSVGMLQFILYIGNKPPVIFNDLFHEFRIACRKIHWQYTVCCRSKRNYCMKIVLVFSYYGGSGG